MHQRSVAENVADRLKAHMRDHGLTQDQVGAELGRAQSVISRWVNANFTWPAADLLIIARYLGVPVADLYDGVEPSTPNGDGEAA